MATGTTTTTCSSSAAAFIVAAAERPHANAGPDQVVNEGTVVTLDGNASSDPDSPNLTYAWVLSSHVGPPITLSSSTSSKPTFQAADDGPYRSR